MVDKKSLKCAVIYQAFIRNETKEGTIKAFLSKLDWIQSLNMDIVYLLPVQLIGTKGRKGSLGSPYAIRDYETMNPEYGTWEEYENLVKEIHKRGMKVMQDIVYNHMARDSYLMQDHPEYFYRDKNGNFGNKIGDWADVADLDYKAKGLEEYLISILFKFKKMGVDGFRFDVASLIPNSFFKKARKALGKDLLFLAECVDTPFIQDARSMGFNADSNSELAQDGFDLFYPYGDRFAWDLYWKNRLAPAYLDGVKIALSLEQANLPKEDKYIVMAIENHDRERIAAYSSDPIVRHNLLAFSFSIKGPGFLYSGEEVGATHLPSLFDKDEIDFTVREENYLNFVKHLVGLKKRLKNKGLRASTFPFTNEPVLLVVNSYEDGSQEYGCFAFDGKKHSLSSQEIPEGTYVDLISNKQIEVTKKGVEFQEPFLLQRIK